MKNAINAISVIIPVYNEERTISHIIEIFRTWGKAFEIIIVNDGSTDHTLGALSQFGKTITVISYKTNRGKGYAMRQGILKSTGDILFFFDGDVVGVTHRDLDALLRPIVQKKADMVLGAARFWSVGSFEPFNDVTGLRVVLRKNIINVVDSLTHIGYGVELFLNDLHKDKRVVTVKLSHVYILRKWEKQTAPDAIHSFVIESRDLLSQFIIQQATSLPPKTMRVLRLLQRYLGGMLDSF